MKESMRFTRQQAEEHQRKHFGLGVEPGTSLFESEGRAKAEAAPLDAEAIPDPPDPMPESEMHQKFGQWLNQADLRRVIHAPFGKKSQLPEGWPDWTIPIPKTIICIEMKGPDGMLEPKQIECIAWLRSLGIEVLVTKSLAEAIMFVKEKI